MTGQHTSSEITLLRMEGEGRERDMHKYKSKHTRRISNSISNYLKSNIDKLKKKLSEISWKLTGIFAQPIYLLDEILEGDNKYSRIVNRVNDIYDEASEKTNAVYENLNDKLNDVLTFDKVECASEKIYQDLKAKMSTNVHKMSMNVQKCPKMSTKCP